MPKFPRRYLFWSALLVVAFSATSYADPTVWRYEWPNTDFSRSSVDLDEIFSGGPPKDGIPAIDDPEYRPFDSDLPFALAESEPVVGVALNGKMRAYPLSILMWHEIVNDNLGGVPIAVTFCPLCNAAIVFDRRIDGVELDFGTTGKLRNSDLVMYDRQTESWWQQFMGEAIVGELVGARLAVLPARLESWAHFKRRAVDGATVLVPQNLQARRYGMNPYEDYDSSVRPFLYRGVALNALRDNDQVAPLARVITIDRLGNGMKEAWALDLLREHGRIETADGFVITWEEGQNSALDDPAIARGRDVGNVVVQKRLADGALEDHPYGVDFAFAYKAFFPDATIVTRSP